MTERDEPYTPSLTEARETYVVAKTRNHDSYLTGVSVAEALEVHGQDFDRMIEAVRQEEREKAAQIVEEAEAIRAAYLDFWGAHSSNDIQHVGRRPRMPETPELDRIREQGKEQDR